MFNVRTGYSFRAAIGMIDDVVARLKETGARFAPLADRASAFGYVRWAKACKAAGLKPIYGVELAVTASPNAKKPAFDYWQFYAIGEIEPINRLVQLATSQFRYEALLTYEQANDAALMQGVARVAGPLTPPEHMPMGAHAYVGLRPSLSRGQFLAAQSKGARFIAASDAKYPRETDFGLYEVMLGRGANSQTYPQHILSTEEWIEATHHLHLGDEQITADAALNSVELWDLCAGKLPSAEIYKPARPATLLKMCEAGAKKLGVSLKDKTYKQRLDYELNLIKEKDFEDYFYIVAGICQFARARMMVGPARGSSCGSLVCYLLEITTIDPLKYDLLFERFIDPQRNDLPDIDIDFSDAKRKLVFEYMEATYGREHVARLGTVTRFGAKTAISETGAALGLPKWVCEKALDGLIERSSGDARAMNTLEDTLKTTVNGRELYEKHPEIMLAARMEGNPKNHSQHAAGVMLTAKPIIHYVAIDARTNATHCDKKDAEDLSLLKIDMLGLTQLSVFEDCFELAGLPLTYLNNIPMNDPAAFKVLNDHAYCGIFQFMGGALQGITNQIKIESLNDIVNITALARPGPITNGGTGMWVKRKLGQEAVAAPHPSLEPYLKQTLGVITYQEQILKIMREVGDMEWGDVNALRKAMSKSLGNEFFGKYIDKFKKGATKKGVPVEDQDKIWEVLKTFGSYSFNLSHSVAYATISYYCAYLKAYYPVEFAAATLTHQDDADKQIQLLREINKEGVDYIPVDKDLSGVNWTVGQRGNRKLLIGPIGNVAGIGPKMVQQIVGARARGEPLPARALKLLENPRTKIDSLWPIRDAFKRLMPDPALRNIHSSPTPVADVHFISEENEVLVFVVFKKINLRDENEAVNIAKRKGKAYKDHTMSLNLQMADDTGVIFGKINRYAYPKMGVSIVERGRPGRAMYAVKGTVPPGSFRMIRINLVRYIGDIGDDIVLDDTVKKTAMQRAKNYRENGDMDTE